MSRQRSHLTTLLQVLPIGGRVRDVLEHGEEAEVAERWLLSKNFDALQSLFH